MLVMPPIDYVALTPTAKEPEKKRRNDAGWDFFADESVTVSAGSVASIHTGIAMAIPDGWYGQLQGRSGLASRGVQPRAFVNAETGDVLGGALDCTYRGEVVILLANLSNHARFRVDRGDKIAQVMFHQVPDTRMNRVESLPPSDRGTKGFGESDGSGPGDATRLAYHEMPNDIRIPAVGPFRPDDELPNDIKVPAVDPFLRPGKDSGGTAVPEGFVTKEWIIRLAKDLYRKRRTYTNQSEAMYINMVARMIHDATTAEGVRMIEEMKDPTRKGYYRGNFDLNPAMPVVTADARRDRLGDAVNRILERRRLVADLAGKFIKPGCTGDEAVKQAADIWGKDHPIVKDVAEMFGVPFPVQPIDVKAEGWPFTHAVPKSEPDSVRPEPDLENDPIVKKVVAAFEKPTEDVTTNQPAFKVPPTINIVTSSKTGPSELPKYVDDTDPYGNRWR